MTSSMGWAVGEVVEAGSIRVPPVKDKSGTTKCFHGRTNFAIVRLNRGFALARYYRG